MVARSKIVKAKWGISTGEPDDLPDFLSNDEIVEKMGGEEPRGVFRMQVKGRPTVVKNKNDDDMIKMILEINDPRKDKKGYNGYAVWENQNITDKGKPFLMKWLKSLGVTWKDFLNNTKQTTATTLDPSEIISIGSVTFGDKSKVYLEAALGRKPARDGYDEGTEVKRWVAKDDSSAGDEDAEEDEVDEDEDEDAADEDEEVELLREELEELGLPALRKRVKGNDSDAKTTGLKKPDLIDLIVEQELLGEEDEEDEDEDEDEDEEELREELGELTLAQLKKRAKDNGRKIAEVRKSGEDDLIEMIVEDELGESEDDNNPPF